MKPYFEVVSGVNPMPGRPIYVDGDYAFRYILTREQLGKDIDGTGGVFSLVVDTLELVVSYDSRLARWIDGYWPYHSWRRGTLSTPKAKRGGLRVALATDFTRGASYRLTDETWSTRFDPQTGWVRIANSRQPATGTAVEFAEGTRAVVNDRMLQAIWIRPTNWIDLVAKFS